MSCALPLVWCVFPCGVDLQLYCYCLLLTFTLLHPATRIGYHQAANNRYRALAPAPAPAPASAEESDILESQASVATIHQPQAVEFCFPLGRAETAPAATCHCFARCGAQCGGV